MGFNLASFFSGELKPIRIHVFPKGPLRTHHIVTTKVLMGLLIAFCLLSIGSQAVFNILKSRVQLFSRLMA